MVEDLGRLSGELGGKPSEADVAAMVRVIETGFKQRLGDNIGDVKQTVNSVIKAVQGKASKEEVAAMISQK